MPRPRPTQDLSSFLPPTTVGAHRVARRANQRRTSSMQDLSSFRPPSTVLTHKAAKSQPAHFAIYHEQPWATAHKEDQLRREAIQRTKEHQRQQAALKQQQAAEREILRQQREIRDQEEARRRRKREQQEKYEHDQREHVEYMHPTGRVPGTRPIWDRQTGLPITVQNKEQRYRAQETRRMMKHYEMVQKTQKGSGCVVM